MPRHHPALPGRNLTTFAGIGGNGFHPAMLRTHARALALSVIPGEAPSQFDCGRQLAILFVYGADRGGIGIGDEEHRRQHNVRVGDRKDAG
jgi:hypothetical protein